MGLNFSKATLVGWFAEIIATLIASVVQAQTLLKHEPPPGKLRAGQVALVDDGSCPKGSIKAVTGGSNRHYIINAPKRGAPRTYRCIPKK